MKDKQLISQLLEPCIKGDRRAQELLYTMLAPKLYGLCLRYAENEYEVQEILQTGFVKVFKNISSFRGDGSFEGWIRKVIVNTAIESYYKRKGNQTFVDINEVHDLVDESLEMNILEAKDLLLLIRTLPEGFRMVFNMYAIEGYSHKEIADALNITEGTSKSQLSRARSWLKKKIKIMEGDLYGINR